MKHRSNGIVVIAALALVTASGCCGEAAQPDGGPCTYEHIAGECVGDGAGGFTFTGTVDGEAVTWTGNRVGDSAAALGKDEKVACTYDRITSGTCSPCEFSVGSCGPEASARVR